MEKIIGEPIPYRFKVSGNLIKKLGEESISNKNVAILELIKNSYDADATKVEIDFKNVNTSKAIIDITDNGNGMTDIDLQDKWFNIATPNKSFIEIEQNGSRTLIGEKGLGRLSSESLGNKVTMLTMPKNELYGCKIEFNWNEYQKENVLANEVINLGYKFKKKKNYTGTKIEISNLKHDWNNQNDQKNLLRDIYLLHPPNKKVKKFQIIPKFHKNITNFIKIRPAFLDKATYYLKTKLSSGNDISYEFKTLKGKVKNDAFKISNRLRCGDVTFELYFYYRNVKYLKDALSIELNPSEMNMINSTLDEYSGVKIYRDNFRVKPYGEPGNDWINLEIAAQNNSMCPRNISVLGMVHLSKLKNPKIIDTTTREGVIFNEEFQDLIDFVRLSILKVFIDRRSEIEIHKKKARKTTVKTKTISIKPVTVSPPVDEKLIDIKISYPQNFYNKLEEEINKCYRYNLPNACFFLSRKMVENLLYNVLEKQFPNNVELYFDTSRNYQRSFSSMVLNLKNRKNHFKQSLRPNIDVFINKVEPFRKEANLKVHRVYDYLHDKTELKRFNISDLVQMLLHVYNNI
ncbi:MAG: hypothetical protein EHM58_04870 [Ignavibacteriae bacterium]|nr:MAG: hypothetical protein EHM58_04870 [Ignavibacteriota bacterium]